MKVIILQTDVVRLDPQANRFHASQLLGEADADLIVLPELFTSGYLYSGPDELHSVAEAVPGGPTTGFIEQLAKQSNTIVVAGVAEAEGETFYNTAIVAGPNGYIGKQRKNHLTKLEKPLFQSSPKPELTVFTMGDVKFAVVTCFDAWFPELTLQAVRAGADILVQPANFGSRQTLAIMRVRAMENQVFCVTANRVGHENVNGTEVKFRGESALFTPTGKNLIEAKDQEGVYTANIDLMTARQKSNVMCDDFQAEWDRYHS